MLNAEALRLKLFLKRCSNRAFAEALNISPAALYRRLSGKVIFTIGEVNRAVEFLGLSPIERDEIFFDQKVS